MEAALSLRLAAVGVQDCEGVAASVCANTELGAQCHDRKALNDLVKACGVKQLGTRQKVVNAIVELYDGRTPSPADPPADPSLAPAQTSHPQAQAAPLAPPLHPPPQKA